MSKGIGRILVLAAAVAVNVIPGAGQFISGTLAAAAVSAGAVTVGAAFALEAAIGSIITLASIAVGLSAAEKVLGLGPKAPSISATTIDRLNASCRPTTPRTMAFGRTAMAMDWRP